MDWRQLLTSRATNCHFCSQHRQPQRRNIRARPRPRPPDSTNPNIQQETANSFDFSLAHLEVQLHILAFFAATDCNCPTASSQPAAHRSLGSQQRNIRWPRHFQSKPCRPRPLPWRRPNRHPSSRSGPLLRQSRRARGIGSTPVLLRLRGDRTRPYFQRKISGKLSTMLALLLPSESCAKWCCLICPRNCKLLVPNTNPKVHS